MPQTLGQDRQGRNIHKGELVEYAHASHLRVGYLQNVIQEDALNMFEIRDKKTNKIYYVFQREIVREIGGRLQPATEKWTKDFMESLALD